MSLKAKLEAVIYAAEEPVTLAQLALLFTADALQWKAEYDAAAQAEIAAAGSEPLPLAESAFGYLEAEGNAAEAILPSDEMQLPEPAGMPASNVAHNAAQPSAAQSSAEAPVAPADTESELKREARQRDRDVRNVLRSLLDELIAGYAADDRGIEIREVAGGYRMATKPECHDAVRGFVKRLKPPLKLSLPALETLAVIAYKQPVTAPEVNEIRGVDSSGVFGSLLSRKLIATAGRKPVVGRPILYKTTREFLLRFGLKDVSELPSMEEFEKLAASELEEPGTEPENEADEELGAQQLPELDEAASEEPEESPQASNSSEPEAQTLEPAASPPNASAGPNDPAESEQVSR
ncbi:MAG TPA: SMC-Scp complex subunit ScpB [Bryobacteraceae bacterium]|nr:SMC-Scp complex subunit ScpB [Bryobacteraceae bacterium]